MKHEALYTGALGAAPALLIALVLEVRTLRFYKYAPMAGRVVIRILMWSGFVGCAVAGVQSIRVLAGDADPEGTLRTVEWALIVGLVVTTFAVSIGFANSDSGGWVSSFAGTKSP